MTEWQPIKDVPKDGTPFLVYWPPSGPWEIPMDVMSWTDIPKPALTDGYLSWGVDDPEAPTHWHPLPDPPQ